MHEKNHESKLQKYEVRVGYVRVEVQCGTPSEALCAARRELSLEFPRMWNVIHSIDESRFEIHPAE